jgi:hypothetical protein
MNSNIADSIGYKLKRATFTGTTNSVGGMPLDLYGDTHVIVSISVISETDKIAFPVNTGLPGNIFALIADITLKIASEGETYTVEVIYYER